MGWCGGCLPAGLVHSTVCYYCLGGCSALVLCARRSRQVWGVGAGAGSRFSPGAPPCPGVPRGVRCGLSCPGVPSPRPPVRHSMRSVRSAGSVWLPLGSAPRALCVCVRSYARGVRPPPPGSVWRATTHGSGAGRRYGCSRRSVPLLFPAPVPCSACLALGGVTRSLRPLAWLGVARPPAGRPAFACWLCALGGRHKGARGGGASLSACAASGVGRPPTHDRPSSGRAAGARYPLAADAGLWARGTVTYPTARALASWLCALWGRHKGARGGGSCLSEGRPGFGALPVLDRPSFGHAAGARYPLAVGAGAVGVGAYHPPHSARSCGLALRAVGATRGRPGVAPLAWLWGVRGWALSHPRPPVFAACDRGPLPTGCGCAGCGRGDPSPTP